MNIRFAVLAHDDAEMLRLLAQSLQPFPVFVHLDRSVNLRDYLTSAVQKMPHNVHFIGERHYVHWGGYSVVKAMRAVGTAALLDAAPNDHVIFLSGRCYPIRPTCDLVRHLKSADQQQFARAYRLLDHSKWHTDRYEKRHWFDLPMPAFLGRTARRVVRNGVKHMSALTLAPKRTTLDVTAGSQWMALTAQCLREAFGALDSQPYAIFKNSFAPDEMAIQTFIYNSRWSSGTQVGQVEKLTSDLSELPNLHYLRPGVSGLVSAEDVEMALLKGAYFIRKLDSTLSSTVIRKINENHLSL